MKYNMIKVGYTPSNENGTISIYIRIYETQNCYLLETENR